MDVDEDQKTEAAESAIPADVALPPASSDDSDSDDSDDDSSDSDVPGKEAEVDTIPAPFDYTGHIDRINRLRQKGNKNLLREARENMSVNFPLSPDLWLNWLEDERQSEKAYSPEGRAAIVALFERAVQDYLSVEIWLEYIQFTIGYMSEPDGSIEKVRVIFEQALMSAGLHVSKGALLWESYKEFELIVLANLMTDSEGENPTLAEQIKRIANLFKRQLSVPLLNMEKTYSAFEEWLDQHKEIWVRASGKPESALVEKNNVDLSYRKATERLLQIQPFEDVLSSCEESMKGSHFKEYLKFEQSLGEPVRLLCLFERAFTECPLDAPLWLGYIEFTDGMGDGEKSLQLCQRAVRNCPWYSLLWQQYIQCLEKCAKPCGEVKGVFEEALKAGMQTAEDFRTLWLEYCSYLRRQIDWGSKTEGPLLLELRETVKAACEHLDQYFGEEGDPSCQLLRFMATVDAVHSRKMDEARKAWNDIMYKGHKNSASSWLQYIHLEMAYGDSKHLRKLFPRALQATRDWPESIVEEWIHFERVEGTLITYEEARFKCRSRMKQVTEERAKAAVNQPDVDPVKTQSKKGEKKQLKGKWAAEGPKVEDRRSSSLKRPAPKDHDKIEQEESSENNSPPKKSRTDAIEDRGTVAAHDPSKDNRTVFVSNLDYATSEEQIKEIFSSVGTITEFRLVKDFKGRSKGFCYVVFSSFNEMCAALKKDRELIDGRPMFVSKCDPDKHTRSHSFKFSTSLEKNKLFVKGLPLSTTKDDLEKQFGEYGKVKDIRLVTYRNGHFKGLAYVDFVEEVSAAHALLKIDGMTMGDKIVSVAISNPPDRRTSLIPDHNEASTSLIQSLGGGAKEVGARGRGRTQVSFMPRALQVKTDVAKSGNGAGSSNGAAKPKSNEEFRKLLMK